MRWPDWLDRDTRMWVTRDLLGLSAEDVRQGRAWVVYHRDGYAPGGRVESARSKEQRLRYMMDCMKHYVRDVDWHDISK